jgi:hypothetical protein
MYAYSWFKIWFVRQFSVIDLGRIWDLIFYEGASILFPIGVAFVESKGTLSTNVFCWVSFC